MGVRRHQYARELEKNIAEGKNLKQAHDKAVELSRTDREPQKTRTGKKAESEEGLLKKTKRRLKELWYGEKTYLKKDKKK